MFDYHTPAGFDERNPALAPWRVSTVSYHSTTIGTDRLFTLILPPDYTEEKTYPVLYLLHGIGGDHKEWLYGAPAEIIGNLAAAGEAPEMIVVIPNVRAAADDRVPKEVITPENIAAFDNFINDLTNDLMPFIKEHYAVKTGRENTAVAGLSMGGRESLFIGFTLPETFGYIGAFSPAPGLLPTPALNYPGQFSEEEFVIKEGAPLPRLIMICNGEQDDIVHKIAAYYEETLTKNGIAHLYYTMPGGHDFTVWKNGLYHFVRQIFQQ